MGAAVRGCRGATKVFNVMCLTLTDSCYRPPPILHPKPAAFQFLIHHKLQTESYQTTKLHNSTPMRARFCLFCPNSAITATFIHVRYYLPFSLSTYKLWHSFSILSLGVVIADSRGFATDLGFLLGIVNTGHPALICCFLSPGEDFQCCTSSLVWMKRPRAVKH